MAKKRKASGVNGRVRDLRIRGELVPTFGDEMLLVRRRTYGAKKKKKSSERAGALLLKAGSELRQPGIKRKVVFKSKSANIFAYSVDPSDPRRIFRDSRVGKRTVGRFVSGRFKAL